MGEVITENLFRMRELPPNLSASAVSVTGTRSYQEDCLMYQVLDDGVLGVVCDGMGGLAHGERSSACAVDGLSQYFLERPRDGIPMSRYWEEAVRSLDETVAELKDKNGQPLGGGTTLAAVFIQGNCMTYAAAGDSMIYLLRNGSLKRLVRMHNYRLLLEQRLAAGDISSDEYEKGLSDGEALITYLGMKGIEVWDCPDEPLLLEDNDRILLCSDGLYKGLSEVQIRKTMEMCPEFEKTALELIRAVFCGPPQKLDNISVLCFLYKEST